MTGITCDTTSFKRSGGILDPVHKHTDGKWYYCDEVWSDCIGPYPTEEEANKQLAKYVTEDNGSR